MSQIHHYETHRRLGSGAHGVAYLATDTHLLRPVVLKIVHKRRASDPDIRRRILEEARLASAIQHPNVCAIYEAGEFDGRPYIVMQYVPGQTLLELLEGGALNIHFALSIGVQIASGLAEAHGRHILHRDLKPANIMITDGGLVKILDFGLAKRREIPSEPESTADGPNDGRSSRFGTTAYMAPEQFVTRRSSEQSDLYALGVILYEMVTGQHPFRSSGVDRRRLAHAIQFTDPARPTRIRPEIPEAVEQVILRAMEKQPSNRMASTVEMTAALKTLMTSMAFESGIVPGEQSALLPSPAPTGKPTSRFAMLVERFLPKGAEDPPPNSIVVLPFHQLDPELQPRHYGLALADMVASRLARVASIVVRPPSAYLSIAGTSDALDAARRLHARYAVTGSYLPAEDGFTVTWQLSEVGPRTIVTGGTVQAATADLVAMQSDIADEVVSALHALGVVEPTAPEPARSPSPAAGSEDYLKARALLTRFLWSSSDRADLDEARRLFETVLETAPAFAPAHAGLGLTHLHYVINGFGGLTHFMSAQRHLESAVTIDPDHVEARINRAYTFLWRGEKAHARREIQQLLRKAGNDAEVLYGAGVILQLDGLLEEALRLFGMALQANPTSAPRIYNRRARIYQYMGQIDLAWHEVDKGLTLQPEHALLRTTRGYLLLREQKYEEAIGVLRAVIDDDPGRMLTYPTLAMACVMAGRAEEASNLITDELVAAAAADCEMAYRLATYCVVDDNPTEALHWLRKAIYLGNENYPWLVLNPAWNSLHDTAEWDRTLADLKRVYRKNRTVWQRFLADHWA